MSSFMAYISRLKHVYRWGLMRSTALENGMEHSCMTAAVAHMLATISNARHGGGLDPGKITMLAVFHDAPEVLTGDLPTPIKYFDPDIYAAYSGMEEFAAERLLGILPEDLRASYAEVLKPDKTSDEWRVVKAADRIAAYLKCVEELKAGNREFEKAHEEIGNELKTSGLPAVADFLNEFAPAFAMTLDQLGRRFDK